MLQLNNGESGELVQALTTQTLSYIGSPGASTSGPVYSSHNVIADSDSLTTAIGKMDAAATFRTANETITGHWIFSVTSASNSPDFIVTDALNTSVSRIAEFTHLTSGTAGVGIGSEIALSAQNGSGSTVLTAALQGVFSTVTAGAEVSNLQFYITQAGASINPLSLSTTNAYSGGLVFPAPNLQIKGNASQQSAGLMIQSHSSGGHTVMALDSANCTAGQRIASLSYGARGTDLVSLGIFNETTGALVYSALCFDSTTGFLGIGTESPDAKLEISRVSSQLRLTHTDGAVYSDLSTDSSGALNISSTGNYILVNSNINAEHTISLVNIHSGASAGCIFEVVSDVASGRFGVTSTGHSAYGAISSESTYLYSDGSSGLVLMADNASGVIKFAAGGSAEMGRITAAGLFGWGTTGPDAKLDVLSTTEQIRQTYTDGSVYASHLVNSSGYYSVVATGNRYGFGTSSPSTDFHFKGDSSSNAVLRLEANGAFDAALQLTSTNTGSGFVWIYDESANTLDLNYDAIIGSGAGRWTINSDGELLSPAVDPPTANYGNRNSIIHARLIYVDGSGSVSNSYNIDSVSSDDGDGQYSINFDTNFASGINYTTIGNVVGTLPTDRIVTFGNSTTAAVTLNIYDVSGAAGTDDDFSFIAAGPQ